MLSTPNGATSNLMSLHRGSPVGAMRSAASSPTRARAMMASSMTSWWNYSAIRFSLTGKFHEWFFYSVPDGHIHRGPLAGGHARSGRRLLRAGRGGNYCPERPATLDRGADLHLAQSGRP